MVLSLFHASVYKRYERIQEEINISFQKKLISH